MHPTYVGRSTAAWLYQPGITAAGLTQINLKHFWAHYSEVLAVVLSVRSQPEGVVAIIIDWREQ